MVKFVDIEAADGGHFPVNPDQVAYLRPPRDPSSAGSVAIVFTAFAGGFLELVVAGPVERVKAALGGLEPATGERRGSETAQTPPGAPVAPRGRQKRRGSRGPRSQQP